MIWPFGFALIFACTPWLGAALQTVAPAWASGALSFFAPLVAFVLVPLVDLAMKGDTKTSVAGKDVSSRAFDSILFIYCFIHVALIVWGAGRVADGATSVVEAIGTTLSVGAVTGAIGITIAHELVHRRKRWQRLLGEGLLVLVSFGHFAVAHVHGHHRWVSTLRDPATARRGQSYYSFVLQAIAGTFLEALHLKRKRTLVSTAATLAVAAILTFAFGPAALAFFLGQSLVAVLLLEGADYVEHYGLLRREIEPGRFEPVREHHSWDSERWLTGKILVHLQRHSDHHLHPLKEYQTLELLPGSKQLPTGYAGMILLALVPPLWRRVMHPILDADAPLEKKAQ